MTDEDKIDRATEVLLRRTSRDYDICREIARELMGVFAPERGKEGPYEAQKADPDAMPEWRVIARDADTCGGKHIIAKCSNPGDAERIAGALNLLRDHMEPSPDQMFEVGSWQGRPAVFVSRTDRPGSVPGTRIIGVGFPVLVISDAVKEPQQVAQMVADVLNMPSSAGVARAKFWKSMAELSLDRLKKVEEVMTPGPIQWTGDEQARLLQAYDALGDDTGPGATIRRVADEAASLMYERATGAGK